MSEERHGADRTGLEPPQEPAPLDEVLDVAGSRRWKRGDTARVVVAALTLVACTVAASLGVSQLERSTFGAVNALPGALYPLVWPVMQIGNVTVAVGLAVVIAIVIRKPRLGLFLVVTPLVAWFVAKAVKGLVQRGRPGPEGLEVTLRGPAEDGFGFISGHATVAFALAAVAMPHLRRPWNYVALGAAVVVGLARLYVGAHLPLDVIGGAATGLLIGEAVRVVEVLTRTVRLPRRRAAPDAG